MRRLSLLIIIVLSGWSARSQQAPEIDSVHMLLLNPYVQIEATQAINDMYNFRFEDSMKSLKFLKYEYGWHPLPYFLMGLSTWWQIQPNLNNTEFDDRFNAYMDTTIVLARRLRKDANPIEGAFFLAASHGFKARLHSDRGNYRKAANEGRKALKFLKESKEHTAYSPELLFGDGLINYYSTWIRENYPWLKPIMLFFPKGDKKLGIEQLREVSRNAFYSRTEAQYYLMNILYHDEKKYGESQIMAEYLHSTYPNNSYFHRWYARMLYQTGRRKQSEIENLQIMQRIDSSYVGYESNTGRYAAYFLGRYYRGQKQNELALDYFLKAEQFAIDAQATDKGYYYQTLYYLGELAYMEKDFEKAKYYYKKVKKLAGRKDNAYLRAKEGLRNM